jgi:hypothetical protein
VKTVTERVAALEAEADRLRAANAELLKLRRAYRGVRVGDVWCYVPNLRYGYNHSCCVMTVAKVIKSKDEVWFEDGGWNDLGSMEKHPGWVLLGRAYKPGDEDRLRSESP